MKIINKYEADTDKSAGSEVEKYPNIPAVKSTTITEYWAHELIKTTTDDWNPNFPGDKIKVRVSVRPVVDIFIVYFCAIGASNYRFELSFETTINKLAFEKYEFWVKILHELPDVVNKQMFIDLELIEKEV